MREIVFVSRASRLVAVALACALHITVFVQHKSGPAEAHTTRAEVIRGRARIIDGDTLDIDGQRIRLHGIDSPESSQSCPGRLQGVWRCGDAARRRLAELAEDGIVCEGRERDKYDRLIGTCFAGNRNINAAMVREGYAWAFIKYASDYVGEQQTAQKTRAGIWAADTPAEPAWEYRKQRWTLATEAAPTGCAIKGNISSSGRIYHVPWSPWYDKVSISPSRGEKWFCDEAEAVAAGWRSAQFQ